MRGSCSTPGSVPVPLPHPCALAGSGLPKSSTTAEQRCLLIGAFPSVCAFWGSLQLSSNSGNPGFVSWRRPEVVLTSLETLG